MEVYNPHFFTFGEEFEDQPDQAVETIKNYCLIQTVILTVIMATRYFTLNSEMVPTRRVSYMKKLAGGVFLWMISIQHFKPTGPFSNNWDIAIFVIFVFQFFVPFSDFLPAKKVKVKVPKRAEIGAEEKGELTLEQQEELEFQMSQQFD